MYFLKSSVCRHRLTIINIYFLKPERHFSFCLAKRKVPKEVWKKGVEFEEGKKDLSSKGLFPLLKYQPLLI